MMDFRSWISLKEMGTSTADVAGFSRPIFVMIRRTWSTPAFDLQSQEKEDKPEKKKSKKNLS